MSNWLKKFGWSSVLLIVLILASLIFFTTQLSNRLIDSVSDRGAVSPLMESPIVAVSSATSEPTIEIALVTPTPTSIPPTRTATPTPQPSPAITNTPLPSPVPRATPTTLPTPLPLISLVETLSPVFFPPQPIAIDSPTAIVLAAVPNSPIATPTTPAIPVPPPTPIADGVAVQVPILMYHFLSTPPPQNANIYRQDLSVSPENFEAQLAYLREENFTSISMDDLIAHLAGLTDLPEKPIVLTFDDGYVDNYTNAFPLLKKYGFIATFFLVTESIDFADPSYMSWDNVVEMHAAGMKFGAHTQRHLDLRNRDVDFLLLEMVGSKEIIEARIGEPVYHFVYPAGRYDQLVLDVVEAGGFWSALTTQYGNSHNYANRFELPRIRMRWDDTLAIFKVKVAVTE